MLSALKSRLSGEVFTVVTGFGNVLNGVLENGFRVTQTHYGPRTIKTDASIGNLTRIMKNIG